MLTASILVRKVRDTKSLHVALWLGVGGLALMGANLVLAGALSPEDFGRLALFQAVLSVAVGVGSLGLDKLSVRFDVAHSWRTLGVAAVSAAVAGLVGGVAAWLVYDVQAAAIALLVSGCIGGALGRVLASFDQAHLRLHRSQLVYQSPYVFFLLGGLLLAARAGEVDWVAGAALLAGGYLFSAVAGLLAQRRRLATLSPHRAPSLPRLALIGRGLSFVGITGSVLILLQLERLIIPEVISLIALAEFSLVATLAGSPFRLLQGGIGYALTPQLRLAESHAIRRRLLRQELRVGLAAGAAASLIVLPAALPVLDLLYGGKYTVSFALVLAVVLSGWVRVLDGLASAAVAGLAGDRELHLFNLLAWLGVALAALLAVLLSGLGAVGVVVGATAGWVLRIGIASYMLRSRFSESGEPVPIASLG